MNNISDTVNCYYSQTTNTMTKKRYYAWFSLLLLGKVTAEPSKSLRGMNNGERTVDVALSTTRRLIIGGQVAKPNDYPYFVHLEGVACGGSLIAPDIGKGFFAFSATCTANTKNWVTNIIMFMVVLTAGHCKMTDPADYKTVHVGRYDYRFGGTRDGAEVFQVVNHYRHPNFDGQLCCGYNDGLRFYGVSNDFLLLKLDGESTKQVVNLDEPTNVAPTTGEELHVMGFGDLTVSPNSYVEPDRLYEVTVNYLSNQDCASSSIYPEALLPPETMCATDYRQDGCQGGKFSFR
jgi:hypothetical protein